MLRKGFDLLTKKEEEPVVKTLSEFDPNNEQAPITKQNSLYEDKSKESNVNSTEADLSVGSIDKTSPYQSFFARLRSVVSSDKPDDKDANLPGVKPEGEQTERTLDDGDPASAIQPPETDLENQPVLKNSLHLSGIFNGLKKVVASVGTPRPEDASLKVSSVEFQRRKVEFLKNYRSLDNDAEISLIYEILEEAFDSKAQMALMQCFYDSLPNPLIGANRKNLFNTTFENCKLWSEIKGDTPPANPIITIDSVKIDLSSFINFAKSNGGSVLYFQFLSRVIQNGEIDDQVKFTLMQKFLRYAQGPQVTQEPLFSGIDKKTIDAAVSEYSLALIRGPLNQLLANFTEFTREISEDETDDRAQHLIAFRSLIEKLRAVDASKEVIYHAACEMKKRFENRKCDPFLNSDQKKTLLSDVEKLLEAIPKEISEAEAKRQQEELRLKEEKRIRDQEQLAEEREREEVERKRAEEENLTLEKFNHRKQSFLEKFNQAYEKQQQQQQKTARSITLAEKTLINQILQPEQFIDEAQFVLMRCFYDSLPNSLIGANRKNVFNDNFNDCKLWSVEEISSLREDNSEIKIGEINIFSFIDFLKSKCSDSFYFQFLSRALQHEEIEPQDKILLIEQFLHAAQNPQHPIFDKVDASKINQAISIYNDCFVLRFKENICEPLKQLIQTANEFIRAFGVDENEKQLKSLIDDLQSPKATKETIFEMTLQLKTLVASLLSDEACLKNKEEDLQSLLPVVITLFKRLPGAILAFRLKENFSQRRNGVLEILKRSSDVNDAEKLLIRQILEQKVFNENEQRALMQCFYDSLAVGMPNVVPKVFSAALSKVNLSNNRKQTFNNTFSGSELWLDKEGDDLSAIRSFIKIEKKDISLSPFITFLRIKCLSVFYFQFLCRAIESSEVSDELKLKLLRQFLANAQIANNLIFEGVDKETIDEAVLEYRLAFLPEDKREPLKQLLISAKAFVSAFSSDPKSDEGKFSAGIGLLIDELQSPQATEKQIFSAAMEMKESLVRSVNQKFIENNKDLFDVVILNTTNLLQKFPVEISEFEAELEKEKRNEEKSRKNNNAAKLGQKENKRHADEQGRLELQTQETKNEALLSEGSQTRHEPVEEAVETKVKVDEPKVISPISDEEIPTAGLNSEKQNKGEQAQDLAQNLVSEDLADVETGTRPGISSAEEQQRFLDGQRQSKLREIEAIKTTYRNIKEILDRFDTEFYRDVPQIKETQEALDQLKLSITEKEKNPDPQGEVSINEIDCSLDRKESEKLQRRVYRFQGVAEKICDSHIKQQFFEKTQRLEQLRRDKRQLVQLRINLVNKIYDKLHVEFLTSKKIKNIKVDNYVKIECAEKINVTGDIKILKERTIKERICCNFFLTFGYFWGKDTRNIVREREAKLDEFEKQLKAVAPDDAALNIEQAPELDANLFEGYDVAAKEIWNKIIATEQIYSLTLQVSRYKSELEQIKTTLFDACFEEDTITIESKKLALSLALNNCGWFNKKTPENPSENPNNSDDLTQKQGSEGSNLTLFPTN